MVATDTLNAGVHFPENCTGDKVASRAVRTNLSDMAAMAATPRWATLNLTLPEFDQSWLDSFATRLHQELTHFGCHLIGGDTTRGPTSVTLTLLGEVEPEKVLVRSGAKPGDRIYVSGELGLAAAGLAYIRGELDANMAPALTTRIKQAYYLPVPQITLAQLIAPHASAALDISDGLLADLSHICKASGVGAKINSHLIPIPASLKSDRRCLDWALAGGDDYQLCFCVPEEQTEVLDAKIADCDTVVTQIGNIVAGTGIQTLDVDGKPVNVNQAGYEHF